LSSERIGARKFATGSRHLRELSALAALAVAAAEFSLGHNWARNVLPQLGFLALILAALCAFSRLYVASTAWFAAATLALTPVLPAYLPRHLAVRPGCTLTIVNFNKEENPPDDEGAIRLLASLHPDIIFAEKTYDPANFAAALLAHGFAGYSSFPAGAATLILSRFPIIHSFLGRGVTQADILVGRRAVRLLNMYIERPNVDAHAYRNGYSALEAAIRSNKGALILAGDGNATVFTRELRRLRTLLHDAWDDKGFGLGATFPGPWRRAGILGPWLRIDYIFHNDAFDTEAVRRIDDAAGAGHYPVWAKLVLVGVGRAGEPCAEAAYSRPATGREKQ
jgi:endonuclease/exonuclease/phosphatase (EEP) superfamily protein YafD